MSTNFAMDNRLSPCRTTVTSFATQKALSNPSSAGEAYEDGDWVLRLCENAGAGWLGCAVSNGSLQVYDRQQMTKLQSYTNVPGDGETITDLDCSAANMLVSSGTNGVVSVFDVRQPNVAVQHFPLPRKGEQALSVSLGYEGLLAAVGSSSNQIHFHDLRNNGVLLGSYRDAHTDEVTRVRFQRQPSDGKATSLLVSASEDGLACVFDTNQPSEEAALKSVLNIGTPLREIGFFGPSTEGIYCLTGSETMSIWHHDSAQRICEFGMDLRGRLSQLVGGGSSSSTMDYLVDCHWDTTQQRLSLLAGNSTGEAAVFQVNAGTISHLHTLQGGHHGVIRSWSCSSNGVFITGGEDARLCEWNPSQPNNIASRMGPSSSPNKGSSVVGGPIRRTKKKHTAVPY